MLQTISYTHYTNIMFKLSLKRDATILLHKKHISRKKSSQIKSDQIRSNQIKSDLSFSSSSIRKNVVRPVFVDKHRTKK